MQEIGFDIISDLQLEPNDSFNWENKATSLYCLLTGNVSSNTRTLVQTITHLSRFYQGIFYVPGALEYTNSSDLSQHTIFLERILESIPNLVILHQNVVVIDGIAIMGVNGWDNSIPVADDMHQWARMLKTEDLYYILDSVKKIQKHLDIKKVILMSSTIPDPKLRFGENLDLEDDIPLSVALMDDTERKVTHWVFSGNSKNIDVAFGNVSYVNNPYTKSGPYWPKRITLSI